MKLFIAILGFLLSFSILSCEKNSLTSTASQPPYVPPSLPPVVDPQPILRSHPWRWVFDSTRVVSPNGQFSTYCCGWYYFAYTWAVNLSGNYRWEFRSDNRIYGHNIETNYRDTSGYTVSGSNAPYVLYLSTSVFPYLMETPYKITKLTNDSLILYCKVVNSSNHELHRIRYLVR